MRAKADSDDNFEPDQLNTQYDQEPVGFLTPQGEYRPSSTALNFKKYLDGIDIKFWQEAFRHMAFVRAFDLESEKLQRRGELGLYVPARGQEAAQVGSAMATESTDTIVPSYREHAVAHVRGVDLVNILALLRGVTKSGWDAETYNFRNYCLVIASQTLHAAGYALGQLLDQKLARGNEKAATIVYFGDGATSQGDLNEALVFAKSFSLPLVFFLQNNHWAISVPVSVQSPIPLYRRAFGFGIPSVAVDGNDILACFAVTKYFMDRARMGAGPAFIEAKTYRMGAHTTSDDPTKYRDKSEEERWAARCPIVRFRKYLEANGVTAEFFETIEQEALAFAKDIAHRATQLADPDPASIFEEVYATDHPLLKQQQAEFNALEDSLE